MTTETKTFRLQTGDIVTSKDGEWPTTYANRTQATKAADKYGGEVIQRGRPFYVRLPTGAKSMELTIISGAGTAAGTYQVWYGAMCLASEPTREQALAEARRTLQALDYRLEMEQPK